MHQRFPHGHPHDSAPQRIIRRIAVPRLRVAAGERNVCRARRLPACNPLRFRLESVANQLNTEHMRHFVRVGLLLREILVKKLYKEAGAKTFKEYLNSGNVGVKYRQAANIMKASLFCLSLPPDVQRPVSEGQIRDLLRLDSCQAVAAWAQITAEEPDIKKISASTVQSFLTKNQSSISSAFSLFISSESCLWYAPPEIVDRVRELFDGTIDLDPCSNEEANRFIMARRVYTEQQDGLSPDNPWGGKVFANVPGGKRGSESLAGLFVDRAIKEHQEGTCECIVLLVKAAIGYKWFSNAHAFPHVWIDSRLAFVPGHRTTGRTATNPHGNCILYLGSETRKFCSLFADLGHIPGYNAWCFQEDKGADSMTGICA